MVLPRALQLRSLKLPRGKKNCKTFVTHYSFVERMIAARQTNLFFSLRFFEAIKYGINWSASKPKICSPPLTRERDAAIVTKCLKYTTSVMRDSSILRALGRSEREAGEN